MPITQFVYNTYISYGKHYTTGPVFYLLFQVPILAYFLNPTYFKMLQNNCLFYEVDIIMCQLGIW